MQILSRWLPSLLLLLTALPALAAPPKPTENDYYQMVDIPMPPDVVLEVGGLGWLDKKQQRLVTCTRRGELWVLDNVYAQRPGLAGGKVMVKDAAGKQVEVDVPAKDVVVYKRMLFGLHEPLGLLVNPGHGFRDGIYMAQRSELTRVSDNDGDDLIDEVETISNEWEVSGSYHEYAFGPKIGKDGQMWITLNRPFGGEREGTAYWRGWAVKVDNRGKLTPICPGLRSPAGLGAAADGEMFYTDNQGDHVASGKLSHIKPDTFQGNPVGLGSLDHPRSTFKLPFKKYPILDKTWREAMKVNPKLQAPTLWFPYPAMGRSQTDILTDTTAGKFGPFAGQMFVGDLSNAIIMRVVLEKVGGEFQGACIPFRQGFTPPVLRFMWGNNGTMFVGGSSRGWGGGRRSYGLARLQWTGKVPFEIHEMKARPKGFLVSFTQKVDPKTAADIKSYSMECWTHKYYSRYGDDQQDKRPLKITKATVGADGKSVVLEIDKLETYYVHALQLAGVRNQQGQGLLHPVAYYTLNRIP
jgi:hypothetical protein